MKQPGQQASGAGAARLASRAFIAVAFAASLLLPSTDARTQADGLADFRAGQALRFNSQGHAKARGLNFTIRYPRSWRAGEAERPNTVQSFVSTDGSGSNCNIVVRDRGAMTEAQAQASVRPEAMRTQLPAGMIFVSGQSTTLDGHPAGEVQARQSVHRAGNMFEARTLMFATVDRKNIFLLTCMAGGRTSAVVDGRFAAYRPLFRLIAGSIVFPDQYR